MATGGLGMGTAPASAPSNLLAQKLRAEAVVKAAAGCFLGCRAVRGEFFPVDVLLRHSVYLRTGYSSDHRRSSAPGRQQRCGARSNHPWLRRRCPAAVLEFRPQRREMAFIVGMALYAVDGLILLSLKDVLGTAFHAYALYRMYRGIAVIPVLQRIEAGDGACGRADRAQINNQICLLRSR